MNAFHLLAEDLSSREKALITISFKSKGRKEVIDAKYDGLFQTVELGTATVPARELRHWLELFYNAEPKSIHVSTKTKGEARLPLLTPNNHERS